MKVIKRSADSRHIPDVTPFNVAAVEDKTHQMLETARSEAQAIVAQAQRKAQSIEQEARMVLQNARDEAEAGKKQGYQDGLAQGRTQGMEEGKQQAFEEMKDVLKERLHKDGLYVTKLLETLEMRHDMLFRQAEDQLLRLAGEIASRILKYEVQLHTRSASRNLRCILREMEDGIRMKVLMHPEELRSIEESLQDTMALFKETKVIVLEGDARIERGGCVVKLEHGSVDLQPSTQLDTLMQALLGGQGGP